MFIFVQRQAYVNEKRHDTESSPCDTHLTNQGIVWFHETRIFIAVFTKVYLYILSRSTAMRFAISCAISETRFIILH